MSMGKWVAVGMLGFALGMNCQQNMKKMGMTRLKRQMMKAFKM